MKTDPKTMKKLSKSILFPPKSGSYAIYQGKILAKNIVNTVLKKELKKYKPSSDSLSLISTCDRKATGTKFGIVHTAGWVWDTKEHFDNKFMKKFISSKLYPGASFPEDCM